MCGLALSIALSLHINEPHTNSVHPAASVNCEGFEAGAYYNSLSRTSRYISYTYDLGEVDLQTGLVDGYGDGIDLMVRLQRGHWFILPTQHGAVLGWELKL